MPKRHILLSIAIILLVSAAILLALTVWADLLPAAGVVLYSLLLVAVMLGLFIHWFKKKAYILVDEMDTAVIFEKGKDKFAYFIDSEIDETQAELKERPFNKHNTRFLNKHLHKKDKYHHFINPFKETVTGRITKKNQSVNGTLPDLRTKEGITVDVSWDVGFKIILTQILPGIEFKMARALPTSAQNMMKGRVNHALRYLIEEKSVWELYRQDALKILEKQLREDVSKRAAAIGVVAIDATDMKLGPIKIPYEVQKAIEAAHERELQTETAVKALEQIKRAINEYDDKDIERLAELERLRILDQHGGALSYEMSNLRKTIEKNKTKRIISDTGNAN